MTTKIQWCDETWNPVTGCTPISEGCKNCYAKRMFERKLWDYDFTPGTFHKDRMEIPLNWKKPRKIFVCSMGDLFHDAVKSRRHWSIFHMIERAGIVNGHTFIILTKRPQNMYDFFNFLPKHSNSYWLGVTAENQYQADERIPILLKIPAAVRFVSVEPMLEPVDLSPWLDELDWVIAGPETGPGKRPCNSEWIEEIHKTCKDAGVPFFDKRDDYLAREWPKEST